jgi:hypothetical protein
MAGRKKDSNAHTIQMRVRMVQEWLMMDHTTSDIVKTGMEKFDVTDRQMMRYIKTATQEFKEMNRDSIEHKRAFAIQRRKKIIRDMDPQYKKTPEGARTILAIHRDISKLDGLYVEKVDMHVEVETDTVVTIGGKPLSKE